MCCSGICEILCVFGWTKHIKKLSTFIIMMMMMMLSWVLTLNFWGWWGGGGRGCINDKRSNDHIEGYFTCGDQWCWEILSPIYLSKYKMLRLSTIFHGLNFIIAPSEVISLDCHSNLFTKYGLCQKCEKPTAFLWMSFNRNSTQLDTKETQQ